MLEELAKTYPCKEGESQRLDKLESLVEDLVDGQNNWKEKVEQIQEDLTKQIRSLNQVLPLTTAGLSWDGEPVNIGFVSSSAGTQTFNLPTTLPAAARMVRIVAFHRSGNEGPSRQVLYRLWTEVEGEHHVHFLYGYRYPQSAISFQAPEFWFPVGSQDRVIKASTESRQPSNDHGVHLYVSGYKL